MPHSHEVAPTCCITNSRPSDPVLPTSHGGPQYHQADLVRLFADPKIARNFKAMEPTVSPFARALILQAFHQDVDNIRKPLTILDNACGTGIISEQLFDILGESTKKGMKLVCGDLSEVMVNYVKEKIEEKGWKNAEARVVDAMKTGLPDNYFTHVITSFGIMLMPDPDAALDECFRMLRPGGTCALSSWDTAGWVPIVRAAFATLPGPPPFPDTETLLSSLGPGSWHRTKHAEEQLLAHGFVEVNVQIARNTMTVKNAAEFVEIFTMMIPFITSKFWSDQERERCGGLINGALMDYLTGKYGEGPIKLDWAAILATGHKLANEF